MNAGKKMMGCGCTLMVVGLSIVIGVPILILLVLMAAFVVSG